MGHQGVRCAEGTEIEALDILGHQSKALVDTSELVDAQNGGMGQHSQYLPFIAQSPHCIGIIVELAAQHLYGDESLDSPCRMLRRKIDLTKATCSQALLKGKGQSLLRHRPVLPLASLRWDWKRHFIKLGLRVNWAGIQQPRRPMIWKTLYAIVGVALMGCSPDLGSEANPVKIQLMPSQRATTEATGQELVTSLHATTGLYFNIEIPERYIDQVVAIGENRADLAFMNNMSYLLANDKYGANAIFSVERGHGDREYKGMVVAHQDSQITNIEQFDSKHIAYVDVHSLSGYIMPAMLLKSQNISPTKITKTGSHAEVVRMVYERKADAGFTYFEEPDSAGQPRDARSQLNAELPDVLEKVVIVTTTDVIPNEPIVMRRGIDGAVRDKTMGAMEELLKTADGKKIFADLNQITGLRRVSDSEYDPIRSALKGLGKRLDEVVPGGGILELKRLEAAEPIPPLGN